MGQTLSNPDTTKHSETGSDDRFAYSVSEMQGWRIGMEDSHATVLALDQDTSSSNAFFAVYDGHGGASVAKYAGAHVHQRLVTEPSYKAKEYKESLKRAFLGTDEDLLADPQHTRDPSGCTAVASLVTHDNVIYTANAGDSRAVISVKGEVKPLSFDHKPQNEVERNRITAAGGYIEFGRVNGNLALSRALGDFEFKKNYNVSPERQVITADPDLTVHNITDEDEFFVIACDGIWDCLSNQQVIDFVRLRVSEGIELSLIGEEICEHLLAPDTSSGAGTGCDNMTVMIIAILNGRTKDQWYEWVKDRVERNYGWETPRSIPQLYPQVRVDNFRARRVARQERDKNSQDRDIGGSASDFLAGAGLGSFARILGSTGGISFNPSSGFMSSGSNLMFGGPGDESDDDSTDDLENEMGERTFFGDTMGLNGSETSDAGVAALLKAKIEEFERDGDSDTSDSIGSPELHPTDLEAALSPSSTLIETGQSHNESGSALSNATNETSNESLHEGQGDKWNPSVKVAEGLLDKSEDPTKM